MTDAHQCIENQKSQALPTNGYNEKGSVGIFYLCQVICELKRKFEDAEKEIKELKEEKRLLISSWKKLKSFYSVDKTKTFLLLYENLREEKNTNGYDIERHDQRGYDCRTKLLMDELSEMKSLCCKKDERIQAQEQQISELKKEVNSAKHSLDIGRTQSKKLEEKLRRMGEEKDNAQQLLLEQQSEFDKMKQFSRSLEEQLRQNEKEKEKAQKLLQLQQRQMGEIKQIAKSSFMNVAKSNTIDDPETERKRIARASEQYEKYRQSARNEPYQDWYRGNEIRKDSVTSNSDSSSSMDSSLKSTNRFDVNQSCPTIDKRKKSATTVITARNVNINQS